MVELWLNFKDENGEQKRVLVEQEKFTIGRTSENDLAIPLNNLSRQHAKIEQFADFPDVFVISDCGSSNGTMLNGEKMTDPVALKNDDKINLGGGLEIEIEIVSDDGSADNGGGAGGGADDEDEAENAAASGSSSGSNSSSSAASGSGASSTFLFIIASVLGVFILLIAGAVLLLSRGDGGNVDITKKGNTPNFTEEDTPKTKRTGKPTPEDSATPSTSGSDTPKTPSGSNNSGGTTTNPTSETTSTPFVADSPTSTETTNSSDFKKVGASSSSFLRRIATKDPKAFLTPKQTNIVSDKIKLFKGSPALADNLKNAKQNSSKIQELAHSKNLTPQFLVVAALTELGNQRGDVLAKATEILGVLNDLKQVLGDEHADDSLITIAALDQGRAGQFNQMRDLLSSLANTTKDDVHSIWFLNDNKKITPTEFDRALRFLAIGTITQNPKDFNVNAEAVSF